MFDGFLDSERIIPLLLVAPVVVVFALYAVPALSGDDLEPEAPLSAVEATHSPDSETVTIRLSSGSSYEQPYTDALVVSRSKQLDGAGGVHIVGAGNTSTHGIWAGQLPGTDRHGVLDLPVSVESNTTVTITADGTDSDGDGISGIERGETLYVLYVGDIESDALWKEREQGTAVVETITIE